MKKYKLKSWVKVVLSLLMVVTGVTIYRYLGFLGATRSENGYASIFILLGWFWLLAGQIMMLYFMWEN